MLYADDIMLASTSRNKQLQVQKWNYHLNHFGLRLNIKKTEYLETITTYGTLQINEENLKMETFWYFGSQFQCDGNINGEIRARINVARMRWQ